MRSISTHGQLSMNACLLHERLLKIWNVDKTTTTITTATQQTFVAHCVSVWQIDSKYRSDSIEILYQCVVGRLVAMKRWNGLNAIDRFQSNIKYPEASQPSQAASQNQSSEGKKNYSYTFCWLAFAKLSSLSLFAWFTQTHTHTLTLPITRHIDSLSEWLTNFEFHCQGDAISKHATTNSSAITKRLSCTEWNMNDCFSIAWDGLTLFCVWFSSFFCHRLFVARCIRSCNYR